MLFDSHCHLHFRQFDNDREEIIKKLRDFNIGVINIGTDLEESEKSVELAKKHPDFMWASVGLHPNDNLKENFDIDKYRKLAKNESVVAIGECGFDRIRSLETDYAVRQKEIFIKQIKLAKELNKPLVLHCRPSVSTQDAYEDAINIIKNFLPTGDPPKGEKFNGVAHFFSGSKETAKKFLDLGFYISFAGPITFAPEYKEIVEFVPLNRILVETDAPFAAPAPYRGKRNEPAYVEFVARKIAEWKGLDFEEVAQHTAENTKKLFQIK